MTFPVRRLLAARQLSTDWFGRRSLSTDWFARRHVTSVPVRPFSSNTASSSKFGLLLDIDGVILRGKHVLPSAKEALKMLVTPAGRFRVPTVFVTNAGNVLRATKAEQLSELLGIGISSEQVLMSHSPLRMFRDFHNKHVLVSGQGPILDIARGLGFTNVTTVDDLRQMFPFLDCVDHARRKASANQNIMIPSDFKPLDAIILFGEPVRWETHLQLLLAGGRVEHRLKVHILTSETGGTIFHQPSIMHAVKNDVLITDGVPFRPRETDVPYPHLPILACNMDLLWLAEAPLPRFGHGTFMLCLETLYQKITGKQLKYTVLMGKPAELTYHHAEFCIKQQALSMGLTPPKVLYSIGDNPESDILGANLFNQYLQSRLLQSGDDGNKPLSYQIEHVDFEDIHLQNHGAERCHSVLVRTGVFSRTCSISDVAQSARNQYFSGAFDYTLLRLPMFEEDNILSALQMIFRREKAFEE